MTRNHLPGDGSPRGGPLGPADLVAAMSEPGFYEPRPERVELRETHISWVFLAGDLVYKVKKPVTFSFVDYSTLERRREMCHEEVRLNRRLAPRTYLGVRAVVRQADGLVLAAEDNPGALEYCVEMRRLPEERTLEALIAAGRAKPWHASWLGWLLASFHDAAEPAPAGRGTPEAVAAIMDDNFRALMPFAGELGGPSRLEAGERFAEAFLAGHRAELEARVRAGFVRDCHGDLRAEHVVLEEDNTEIFDCLEFNPGLRQIDVASDLAFLLIDLERLGGPELAQALLTAYRGAGGDPGSDRLLAFYGAYRAWVRAKVACLRTTELPVEDPAREAAFREARRLGQLARRMAWHGRLPLVLVFAGVTASGKTYLADALAEISGLPHLSSDVMRKYLAGLAPTERAEPKYYTESFSALTYNELGVMAGRELEREGGVLVDATFRRRHDRQEFAAGLGDPDAACVFIECGAPIEVLVERAATRQQDAQSASDAGPELVERQRAEWEPLDEVPADSHLPLRSDRPVDLQLDDLEALLDERLAAS